MKKKQKIPERISDVEAALFLCRNKKRKPALGDTPEYRQGHHDGRSEILEHAQRLVDTLKECETSDNAAAFIRTGAALRRLKTINKLVRETVRDYETKI